MAMEIKEIIKKVIKENRDIVVDSILDEKEENELMYTIKLNDLKKDKIILTFWEEFESSLGHTPYFKQQISTIERKYTFK